MQHGLTPKISDVTDSLTEKDRALITQMSNKITSLVNAGVKAPRHGSSPGDVGYGGELFGYPGERCHVTLADCAEEEEISPVTKNNNCAPAPKTSLKDKHFFTEEGMPVMDEDASPQFAKVNDRLTTLQKSLQDLGTHQIEMVGHFVNECVRMEKQQRSMSHRLQEAVSMAKEQIMSDVNAELARIRDSFGTLGEIIKLKKLDTLEQETQSTASPSEDWDSHGELKRLMSELRKDIEVVSSDLKVRINRVEVSYEDLRTDVKSHMSESKAPMRASPLTGSPRWSLGYRASSPPTQWTPQRSRSSSQRTESPMMETRSTRVNVYTTQSETKTGDGGMVCTSKRSNTLSLERRVSQPVQPSDTGRLQAAVSPVPEGTLANNRAASLTLPMPSYSPSMPAAPAQLWQAGMNS